jgi:hypothetical protein
MSSNPFNKISDKIREFRFKREVKTMLKGSTDTSYKLQKRSFKTALPKLDLTKKENTSKHSFFNRSPKIEKIRPERAPRLKPLPTRKDSSQRVHLSALQRRNITILFAVILIIVVFLVLLRNGTIGGIITSISHQVSLKQPSKSVVSTQPPHNSSSVYAYDIYGSANYSSVTTNDVYISTNTTAFSVPIGGTKSLSFTFSYNPPPSLNSGGTGSNKTITVSNTTYTLYAVVPTNLNFTVVSVSPSFPINVKPGGIETVNLVIGAPKHSYYGYLGFIFDLKQT